MIKLLFREWDRFAKAEYERLAMEEEGGDESDEEEKPKLKE